MSTGICGEDFYYHYESCSGSCKNGQCSSKESSCSEGEVECIKESKLVYVCSAKGKMVKQCSDDDECYDEYCNGKSKDNDGEEPEEDDVDTGVISSGSCSQQSGHGAIGGLLLPVAALIYRRRRRMC